MRLGRESWEERWSRVLGRQGHGAAGRPPNPHLAALVAGLPAGRALDAGCGHGSDALWLASSGWHVTAVDFSTAALAHGRATAEALGPELAARVDWVEGDLATWAPESGRYDLVTSFYFHIEGAVAELVQRLASGVAAGGTLLLVGHRPTDPATGKPTAAAGQTQVSVDAVLAALPAGWRFDVAEERPRARAGSGVDAVVAARRQP